MFETVKRLFKEEPHLVIGFTLVLLVLLGIMLGCSVGKVAFQAEDVKVQNPYVPPNPP